MKCRIQLGYVALDLKGRPHAGSHYQAGAKVYSSEGTARSAVRNHKAEYIFAPAYAEIEVEEESNGDGTTE